MRRSHSSKSEQELFEHLKGFLNARWRGYWQKAEEKFWEEFDEKTAHIR
jgi:hypothetical protein